MSYKNLFIPLFILLISIIPLLDLFHPGLPQTHDGQDHVARIANFYQNLTEGNIIPRWAGNLNWGYGHPILMFLYPLPSYIASFFHFLGFSLVDSTKLVFGLAFILSGITMYLWIRDFLGELAGIASAALYMFAPYRFVDLYVRGAVGEHVAFVFMPLILYFLLEISKASYSKYTNISLIKTVVNRSWLLTIVGSLSVAYLILSHNAISLMFFPLIFLYAIYLFWKIKDKKYFILHTSYFILLGFGLAAFFWIPAFFEGKYTLRNIVTAKEYASRFTDFAEFIYGQWNYGGTNQLSKQVGIVQWVLTIASVPIATFFYKKKNNKWKVAALFLIFWFTIFLMTPLSKPVWDKLTVLQKFQFPWRFLSVVVFITSLLGGIVISVIPQRLRLFTVLILIVSLMFINKNYWHAKGYLYKNDTFFSGIYNGTTDTGESSPIWSVRFMEKRPKAHIEVISGEAAIKEISRNSTVHVYEIDASKKSRILENTLYFPGWEVLIDGKAVKPEFQDPRYRGLMTFFVDKGKHNLEIKFGETKLRTFADIISIASILAIIPYLVFGREKKYNPRDEKDK